MLNLEKLLEYGLCRETKLEACSKCPFDFYYEGRYLGGAPRTPCEIIEAILWEAADREAKMEKETANE